METSILETLHSAFVQSACSAWVLVGADNMRYATRVHVPFTDAHPGLACVMLSGTKAPAVLAPHLWAACWQRGAVSHVKAWKGSLCLAAFTKALLAELLEQGVSTIGLDVRRVPAALFKALNKHVTIHDISPILDALRANKTMAEIALLRDLAYRADHAVLGATHHSLACDQRAEKGLAEIIRIHALERGFASVGYNAISQAATGEHARQYWTEAPKFGVGQGKRTARGEYNRLELQATLDGYWAFSTRLMTMGQPTDTQRAVYDALVAMREAALLAMRPGVLCSAVYAAMLDAVRATGITPVTGMCWGHSIGVNAQEAPYFAPEDHTPLAANAVMVLNPHVLGPDGEVLFSRDTVLVNACGCTVVGWYKDWREPYVASDSYYSGGG